MPELPDVEIFRGYLDSTALHKRIESVQVEKARVIKNTTVEDFTGALPGNSFLSTRRHGKHMFVEMDKADWLRLHFGMSGYLKYFRDADDRPEHTRVLFQFDNGYYLAYVSQRMLGELSPVKSPEEYLKSKGLGPDALDIDSDQFLDLLKGRRGMIKTTLMNQQIIAGLGNIYTDEVLFQAGIMPDKKTSDLKDDDLKHLYQQMISVIETAIEKSAQPDQFPSSYLTPRREEGSSCPRCSGEINKTKVSQRGTYYCPSCQS